MQLAPTSSPVRMPRMGKREQRWNDPDAHTRLRKIYEERVPEGMTQEQFGAQYGIGNQSMVWQYLSGKVPLSLEAAGRFARALGCTIHDFSPMLADQLKADILPFLGPKSWWRNVGKMLLLVLFVGATMPSPQSVSAAVFSPVAALVYYVKCAKRRIIAWYQENRSHSFARF
jgi:transcriptional regulator with XRE-family HTH domain